MNATAKCVLLYLIGSLFLASVSVAQDTTEIVTAWLKQNSIPIKYIEAGNGFSDLQALKKILQGAQVVGLGEATHGTQEFVKMKHRLIEFLVTQMGFTALALESSYSNCQPINDYILTGKGDLATVLTGQGYTAWDTEEFSSLLDWLRSYNQKVPDERKVRFYGLDVLSFCGVGREKVLAYIKRYAPEEEKSTDSLFDVLADEEEKWPRRLNQAVLQSAFMPLHELIGYFTMNKDKLVASSSPGEWEQTYKYLEVMQDGLFVNMQDVPAAFASQQLQRDEYMAQNLLYILKKEKPGTKFMVWEHNWHIGNRSDDSSLGYHLRQALADKYYSIGLQCYEGTFQAREVLPDGFWGDLRTDTIPAVEKSLGWYLKRTGEKNLFFNLSTIVSDSVVNKWLETPISFVDGHWAYRNAGENFETRNIKDLYNAILFIESSTPVHPTKNALARSAERIGF
jgi:erythromycin esterase